MRFSSRKAIAFISVLLFLIFPSCEHLKKAVVDYIPLQPEEYIEKGEYQKALDAYKTEHMKNPKDKTFTRRYIKALEDMKNTANISYDREDFSSAGILYNILLRNYPDFTNFKHLLSFDDAFLSSRFTECSKTLFHKGLEEYRNGNLKKAISLWESQLAFDHNNADALKAIKTAHTQLQTLQEKK